MDKLIKAHTKALEQKKTLLENMLNNLPEGEQKEFFKRTYSLVLSGKASEIDIDQFIKKSNEYVRNSSTNID